MTARIVMKADHHEYLLAGIRTRTKYIVGGAIEIGMEAVAAHYFRNRGQIRKWYVEDVGWELPQTVSLYEHAHAAYGNAAMNLGCSPSAPLCR